ncbi:MAG: ATP-binding protein [Chloroflexales bacterium]|nr:ATP-binding protein [Chloroflexales bacterium]
MPPSHEFGALLTEAVYRIRSLEGKHGKSIQIVQDELGYAIGRESGGSAIEHWRKGNVPLRHQEVEALAREIMRRTDLSRHWLERFLSHGRHPHPLPVCDLLRPEASYGQPAARPAALARVEDTRDAAGLAERSVGAGAPAPAEPDEACAPAPFVAGPPITHPRSFFGRGPIVRRIFDLLRRLPLQNAAIIGPRRSGKTSLLHYVRAITATPPAQLRPGQRHDWLPEAARYRWVLIDFQDARLGHREGLLRYTLSCLGLPAPEPCTLDRFLDVMGSGVRQPTVMLLDEIGSALQRYPELNDELWESLRSLGPQLGGRLGFVLTSHISPVRLAHDTGHSSPFFNIFGYTANLGPFSEQEAHELIAASPRPFPERDIAWISEHSRGWPVILQTLCRERLGSLDAGVDDDSWRAEALCQIEPYAVLP